MRNHIRREASLYGTSWWLAPIAFATAALAAIASIDPDSPFPPSMPAAAPATATMSAQPASLVTEPTPALEHIQAF
jgi:hypothetical protein